jgi:hypothetical protein
MIESPYRGKYSKAPISIPPPCGRTVPSKSVDGALSFIYNKMFKSENKGKFAIKHGSGLNRQNKTIFR